MVFWSWIPPPTACCRASWPMSAEFVPPPDAAWITSARCQASCRTPSALLPPGVWPTCWCRVSLLASVAAFCVTVAVWLVLTVFPCDVTTWSTEALFELPVWVIVQTWTAVASCVLSLQVALFRPPGLFWTTTQVWIPPLLEPVTMLDRGPHSNRLSSPDWSTRLAVVQVQPLPGHRGPA